jgi:hypothetical protein
LYRKAVECTGRSKTAKIARISNTCCHLLYPTCPPPLGSAKTGWQSGDSVLRSGPCLSLLFSRIDCRVRRGHCVRQQHQYQHCPSHSVQCCVLSHGIPSSGVVGPTPFPPCNLPRQERVQLPVGRKDSSWSTEVGRSLFQTAIPRAGATTDPSFAPSSWAASRPS